MAFNSMSVFECFCSSLYGLCFCVVVGVYGMAKFKKRKCLNAEVDDDVTEESSYCKMKARLKKKEDELEEVCVRLQLTEQRLKEVEGHFEQAIKVLQDTLRQKEDLELELTVVRSELREYRRIHRVQRSTHRITTI